MGMRDYEDLKNLKIPAEQERIMDIICDAKFRCGGVYPPTDGIVWRVRDGKRQQVRHSQHHPLDAAAGAAGGRRRHQWLTGTA